VIGSVDVAETWERLRNSTLHHGSVPTDNIATASADSARCDGLDDQKTSHVDTDARDVYIDFQSLDPMPCAPALSSSRSQRQPFQAMLAMHRVSLHSYCSCFSRSSPNDTSIVVERRTRKAVSEAERSAGIGSA